MRKCIASLFACLTWITMAAGGQISGPLTLMGDLHMGSWHAMTSAVVTVTAANGAFTSGPYTNWYRISGTNLAGRLPASTNLVLVFQGTTNGTSNAVQIAWEPTYGVLGYVILRSFDAGSTWTNWTAVAAGATNWIDYGSNTWTQSDFLARSLITDPNVTGVRRLYLLDHASDALTLVMVSNGVYTVNGEPYWPKASNDALYATIAQWQSTSSRVDVLEAETLETVMGRGSESGQHDLTLSASDEGDQPVVSREIVFEAESGTPGIVHTNALYFESSIGVRRRGHDGSVVTLLDTGDLESMLSGTAGVVPDSRAVLAALTNGTEDVAFNDVTVGGDGGTNGITFREGSRVRETDIDGDTSVLELKGAIGGNSNRVHAVGLLTAGGEVVAGAGDDSVALIPGGSEAAGVRIGNGVLRNDGGELTWDADSDGNDVYVLPSDYVSFSNAVQAILDAQ
jgi:hypothetical protein